MNLSEFYTGYKNDNDRLEDLCRNLRNLRVQLVGEFPSKIKDTDDKQLACGSLVSALEYQQNRTGAIMDEIWSHMQIIRSSAGEFWDPEHLKADDFDPVK